MNSKLRIIVSGMVGVYPVGGVAWDYLNYVIGLARLGHDVYYHEDTWSWPYNPVEKTFSSEDSYSAKFISNFFEQYAPDLIGRWHYLHLHEKSLGMDRAAFEKVARTADLFINVSGACLIPDELSPQCVKVFLDTDPGYNQIILSERPEWSENVDRWCESVAAHDKHFTYAENIHGPDCLIPKMDFVWKTTRMPVLLDLWHPFVYLQPPPGSPWTTVMSWNVFKGKLMYRGVEYKSKEAEFEKLLELPRRVGMPLKVAVGGVKTALTRRRTFKRLTRHGWHVVDGPSISITPEQYQKFIAASRGEISPAKHVYVAMRSGWFSGRSACYLAASRPVVVQDTGFSSAIPPGEGLLSFSTMEEAAAALQEIEENYAKHAQAAWILAQEFFHSEKVLTRLVEEALGS